jgi:GTP-binding protein
VAADVPGLIEGAGQGKGLGIEFLRHVERTRVLVHLIDPAGFQGMTVLQGIKTIESELRSFGRTLEKKPRVFVVNKMDLPEGALALKALRSKYRARKPLGISAATGEGISEFLDRLILELSRCPASSLTSMPEPRSLPKANVRRLEKGFQVDSMGGGTFKVRGSYVERASAMLDPALAEAMARFQKTLKRIGVDRELKSAGIKEGDTVRCGAFEFVWSDAPKRTLPILIAKGLSGKGRGGKGFRLLG